jgi:hypothetical protein
MPSKRMKSSGYSEHYDRKRNRLPDDDEEMDEEETDDDFAEVVEEFVRAMDEDAKRRGRQDLSIPERKAAISAFLGHYETRPTSPSPEVGEPRRRRSGRGPLLSEAQILGWARAYREAKGRWPSAASPPADLPEGETWKRLDASLRHGWRGLPGGSSLSLLLRVQA